MPPTTAAYLIGMSGPGKISIQQISREWESIVDALSEIILLIDHTGLIRRANRAVESWGLADVRHCAGLHFHSLLHPDCASGSRCYLLQRWQTWLTDSQSHSLDFETDDPVLQKRLRMIFTQPTEDFGSDGSRGAVLLLKDVTAQHQRDLRDRQRSQLEAVGRLLYDLAHSVGNPLATIRTSTQLLLRDFQALSDGHRQQYLSRIAEAVHRLQALFEVQWAGHYHDFYRERAVDLEDLVTFVQRLFLEGDLTPNPVLVVPEERSLPSIIADPAAAEYVVATVVRELLESAAEDSCLELLVRREAAHAELLLVLSGKQPGPTPSIPQRLAIERPDRVNVALAQAGQLMAKMGGSLRMASGDKTVGIALRFPLDVAESTN